MEGVPASIKRKSWNKQNMIDAVLAVREGRMGYQAASKKYEVPKITLRRYVLKDEVPPSTSVQIPLGRKPALPERLELKLVEHCIEMDRRFFGPKKRDVLRMAYQVALRNNISNPFQNETAGRTWFQNFMKRHPTLKTRISRAASGAKAKEFSPDSVQQFFNVYESEFEKIKRKPYRIYNVVETGLCVVEHEMEKLLIVRGKKEAASLTSVEREKLITVVICMNAIGSFVPPLIVWPRKNMDDELMDGAPPGSIWACHPSGWIQTHIFTMWFDHFIRHTNPTADNAVLLVLDGHSVHTRNTEILEKATENNVSIVCLPPHSSRKLQPLEVSFMEPFKVYYSAEIETALRSVSQGNRYQNTDLVTPFSIARLFNTAYCKAATMEISANGFKKTGLFPLNREIFRSCDFSVVGDIHNGAAENFGLGLPAVSASPNFFSEPTPGPSGTIVSVDMTPLPYLTLKRTSRKSGYDCVLSSPCYEKSLQESLDKANKRKKSSGDVDDNVDDDNYTECLFCGCNYKSDNNGEKWAQCIRCFHWGHEECGATGVLFTCPTCRRRRKLEF